MRATTHGELSAASPGSPRLWALLGAAGICALGFLAVAAYVFDGGVEGKVGPAPIDRPIAQFLEETRYAALTGRVGEVSALGSAPVLAVLALLAYSVVIRARDRVGLLHLSVALLGASIWSRVLQGLFERERPEGLLPFIVVTKGSFPSAHLFGATACYLTFAFFYARYASFARPRSELACYALASVLIFLIGTTRVYLGAHHATDVMGGIAAGAAWAFLVAAMFTPWYRPAAARR